MNYEQWHRATYQHYDDPTEYNGQDIDYCKRCDMEPKYCDTDVCMECIDELEEMQEVSLCCGDTLHIDTNRCTSCYEWSESEFDEHCTEHNFNRKTFKYEYRK